MKAKTRNPFVDLIVGTIKFVVVGVYRLFFGWWIGPLQAKGVRTSLESRVLQDLAFVFEGGEAHFLPTHNTQPALNVIVVESDGILLRIAHNRGQDFVDVSPRDRTEWEPVSLVLMALDAKGPIVGFEDVPPYISFLTLSELAPQLRPRFENLKRAYSPNEYAATKQVLQRISSFPRYAQTSVLTRQTSR
jgi:hypothetical protein